MEAKKKIMIVDDDKDFLMELEEVLTTNGYDTVTCSDGVTALKLVKKAKPAAMLLDLNLGRKNGFQVAHELKKIPAKLSIPIIAMTGYYTEREHAMVMNLFGIEICMIKPFDPVDVIAKIEMMLNKKVS